MFDIGWMELMIVGLVALLVVGPKELPGLLRTLGKYAGMLKKQAREFRAQFEEAIQDSEFQDLKKDVESIGEDADASMHDVESSLREDLDEVDVEFDKEVDLDDEFDDGESDVDYSAPDGVEAAGDASQKAQEAGTAEATAQAGSGDQGNAPEAPMNGAAKDMAHDDGGGDEAAGQGSGRQASSMAAEGKG